MSEKFLDPDHAAAMLKVLEAYRAFCEAVQSADGQGFCWVPEAVIKFDSDTYARCFTYDDEYFVEPIFNVVRPIEER